MFTWNITEMLPFGRSSKGRHGSPATARSARGEKGKVPWDTHVVGVDLNDDLHDGALCPVGGDGAPGKLAADGKAGVTGEHAAAHAACDCGARPVH